MSESKQEIMLVEDDPAILKLTSRILQALGYTVHGANNGTEALTVYEEHKSSIGAVLTDLQMPVISGRDLAIKLREQSPSLPIVFVSGYSQEQVSDEIDLEHTLFIQKPFNKAKLNDVVSEALAEKV